MSRARPFALVALVTLLGAAACEKTDHDTIEKWGHTQKGPGKLKKTLRDESVDPDLAAHAAVVMITHSGDADVREVLNELAPLRRAELVKALAPRLWQVARLEKDTDLPVGDQAVAKDWLFNLNDDPTEKVNLFLDDSGDYGNAGVWGAPRSSMMVQIAPTNFVSKRRPRTNASTSS